MWSTDAAQGPGVVMTTTAAAAREALIKGLTLATTCAILFSWAPAVAAGLPELAFVSLRHGDAHIFVRDADGQERQVTSGKTINTQPSLAANGRLAYVSMVDGRPVVFLEFGLGEKARRLTSDAGRAETSPSWSPDGRQLAFYSLDLGNGSSEMRIVELESRREVSVPAPGKGLGPSRPEWSADGSRLVFLGANDQGRSHIWAVQHDGSQLRNLSESMSKRGGAWPSLSPDGSRVVWSADMRGRLALIVTRLDDGQSTELASGAEGGHESTRWSPDGTRLVTASRRGTPMAARNDIFVMNADGSAARNLSNHPGEDFDPRWTPDGKRIVFASLRTGTSLLYEVAADGGVVRPLATHTSHDMDHITRPAALPKQPE